jgi:hypothetical protein
MIKEIEALMEFEHLKPGVTRYQAWLAMGSMFLITCLLAFLI